MLTCTGRLRSPAGLRNERSALFHPLSRTDALEESLSSKFVETRVASDAHNGVVGFGPRLPLRGELLAGRLAVSG